MTTCTSAKPETFSSLVITGALQNYLLSKEQKFLDEQLDQICASHALTSPGGNYAFHYRGTVWLGKKSPIYRNGRPTVLTSRLREQMDEWLNRQKRVEEERAVIHNFMGFVYTESSRTDVWPIYSSKLQRVRLLLPECCQSVLPNEFNNFELKQEHLELIKSFQQRHADEIQIIKERVVTNLLI